MHAQAQQWQVQFTQADFLWLQVTAADGGSLLSPGSTSGEPVKLATSAARVSAQVDLTGKYIQQAGYFPESILSLSIQQVGCRGLTCHAMRCCRHTAYLRLLTDAGDCEWAAVHPDCQRAGQRFAEPGSCRPAKHAGGAAVHVLVHSMSLSLWRHPG